jgi:hypothetical protein
MTDETLAPVLRVKIAWGEAGTRSSSPDRAIVAMIE